MYDSKVLFCVVCIIINLLGRSEGVNVPQLPPPCYSEIYCHGRLLDTIQMAKIYADSKTFVDMKMKYPPNETLAKFDEFMEKFKDKKPTRNEVKHFVNETFEKEGQEFEKWEPNDWIKEPSFINGIKDEEFKEWARKLNAIWKSLGRKLKEEVKLNPELYSIIWVPHPVIVPGGRFREFYYWDSYWIVQGLLLSEMNETVKGILENFLYIVKTHGHIPNGGRIYYLARSQPPLLIPMVQLYLEYTKDTQFIVDNIDIMEREFEYWMINHTINVVKDDKNYTLAIYGDKSNGPRPESYSEDVEVAEIFKDQPKKEAFYTELKAAAESGWDFSSRWFILNATNKGNLTNIKTRSIVPVDLNAIIYWDAVILADFHDLLNNTEKAKMYREIAEKWLEAVTAVLWHDEVGVWLDYDLQNSIKRDYFYPTNIAPLWTGCFKQSDKESITKLVLKYLQNKKILLNPGGIPTTFEHTGEQWDYPNAWPPLQHIMIAGLNNTGDSAAQQLALEITQIWVRSNYKAFKGTEAMYEKYDATVPGQYGGGGEYEVQFGFGWSNGIIMDLLYKYPNLTVEEMVPESIVDTSGNNPVSSGSESLASVTTIAAVPSNSSQITLIALLVSLSVGFIG